MSKAPDVTIHVTDKQIRALGQGLNLSEIRSAIPELEAACNRKIEAAEDFDAVLTMCSLKSGIIKSVLSQYIVARVTDTVKKKSQSAEQLSLLFGEDIA